MLAYFPTWQRSIEVQIQSDYFLDGFMVSFQSFSIEVQIRSEYYFLREKLCFIYGNIIQSNPKNPKLSKPFLYPLSLWANRRNEETKNKHSEADACKWYTPFPLIEHVIGVNLTSITFHQNPMNTVDKETSFRHK